MRKPRVAATLAYNLTSYTYDAKAQRIPMTDANQRVTMYTEDAARPPTHHHHARQPDFGRKEWELRVSTTKLSTDLTIGVTG